MPGKILIVEDDRPSARLVGYALEKEGYQIILASNGIEGLKKAMEEAPDLVVLDVMLPGLDGFEVCHRLKTRPGTTRLPILMLSAKAQESDLLAGEKVGADKYLVKPVDPSYIVETVGSLLREHNSLPATPSGQGS